MNTVVQAARRLVQHRPGHRVISLYLDLDPERFATAPARSAQIRSLTDEAAKELDGMDGLGHAERVGLREDLDRVRDFLLSGEPPVRGARALAVFCSGRGDLFETIRLPRPVPGRVVIDAAPYVEPMLAAAVRREWLVLLVNRRQARVFTGPADAVVERQEAFDDTRGQHDQGGWSQSRYERSIEKEVDEHLRATAEIVERRWRRDGFDRLAVGGPPEIVPRLEGLLSGDVRTRLVPERLEVDVATTGESALRDALSALAEADERRSERCPSCGLLVVGGDGRCPADGTELEPVEHLREATVEAALAQDAEVVVVRHHPDLGPFRGIGAVLRF